MYLVAPPLLYPVPTPGARRCCNALCPRTPYRLRWSAGRPRRADARCCDMPCDCISKYHGRASRDALRVWSGWASTVIHGPRHEPDYGPCYVPGRRATLRVGPPGRATHRAAGPRYAPGRGPGRTNYLATAPLDLRTKGRATQIHTNGHQGPAPLESTAGFMYSTLGLRSGVGLGLLESTTHRWTGQLGPRHPPAPARTCSHTWLGTQAGAGGATSRWANPVWNGWKAETTAGRARTDLDLDVGVMEKSRYLPSFPIARWEITQFHQDIYPFRL